MAKKWVCFAVLSLLLALPAAAQEQAGNLGRVYFVKPKAGMELQYEEAAKRHMDWHRQEKDTWTWHTWQVVNGEQLGQYVVGTFNHSWEDFDAHAEFDAADTADALANLSKYTESVSNIITLYHEDVSRPLEGDTPLPLSQVIRFQLNVGVVPDFTYWMKKVHEAVEKTNWPPRYSWQQAINGTEGPVFVLILSRKNWAGFSPPEKPFDTMMEEAYGRREADALRKVFQKSVRSVRSETTQYRPDMNYIPAGQ